jgi:hypothetical protein
MAEALDLALLQQWVYRSITHPGGVAQGAADAAAALGIGHLELQDLVQPTGALSAGDRLAIYHNAYHLRLMEVLEAEYPALKLALGDELFGKFALLFLQQQPPSSFTLYQLSARFPGFLSASVPEEERAMGWPAFIIDLALLERTFQEVYRGPGTEGRAPATAGHPLAPAPCLRLMACSYPVHEFLVAARKDQAAEWPAPCTSYLAICRRDYQVRIHALSREEYECLRNWSGLPASGMPMEKWLAEGFFA